MTTPSKTDDLTERARSVVTDEKFSRTHAACVRLIANGDGPAIRHYGDRGRKALVDLEALEIVTGRALTPLGHECARLLLEEINRET